MATKRPSLGRGLGALLGQPTAAAEADNVTPLRGDEAKDAQPGAIAERLEGGEESLLVARVQWNWLGDRVAAVDGAESQGLRAHGVSEAKHIDECQ